MATIIKNKAIALAVYLFIYSFIQWRAEALSIGLGCRAALYLQWFATFEIYLSIKTNTIAIDVWHICLCVCAVCTVCTHCTHTLTFKSKIQSQKKPILNQIKTKMWYAKFVFVLVIGCLMFIVF